MASLSTSHVFLQFFDFVRFFCSKAVLHGNFHLLRYLRYRYMLRSTPCRVNNRYWQQKSFRSFLSAKTTTLSIRKCCYPIPSTGWGHGVDHGDPKAVQLPKAWTRRRTDSQKASTKKRWMTWVGSRQVLHEEFSIC